MAAAAATLTAVASGTCYAWVAQILARLLAPDSEVPMTASQSSWMVSAIDIGNFISPIPAAILVNRIGRKPCILSTGPMFLISWLLIAYIKKVETLYICRTIQGVAIGVIYTTLPVYLSEISRPNIRGMIMNMFQISVYFGIFFEYSIGPYFSFTNLTLITAIFPALFTVFFSLQPESPYYLIMKGNDKEAAKSLAWLRRKQIHEVRSELDEIANSVKKEMEDKVSCTTLIARQEDRRALALTLLVGGTGVLSGITSVWSYATDLFSRVSPTFISPHGLTITTGFVMFLASCCGSGFIDMSGRRPILLVSTVGCGVSMLSVSIYCFLNDKTDIDVSSFNFLAPLSTILYCAFFTFGLDPVITAYRSELFPSNTRSYASCICALVNTSAAFFTMKCYQPFTDTFGVYFNYLLYSLFSLVGATIMYFAAVETKGKSLSEVQARLRELSKSKKTRTHNVNISCECE